MKKIFGYIAAAVALTFAVSACSDALAPAESSTQPTAVGTVEIVISNVTDNSFDVTFAPKGKAAYYSYLVDDDEPAVDQISPAKLYSVSYESVAQGTVKYTTGSESKTITVNTEPNTLYTIYAVAASPEGNVGAISYKTVTTSDGVDPGLEEFAFKENVVALAFGEAVLPVEGKKVKAKVYTGMTLDELGEVEGEIVANKGGVVQVKFADITVPGSVYIVNFEEGTFTDLVGNPCPALSGDFEYDEAGEVAWDEDDEFPLIDGVGGYLAHKAFKLDDKNVPASITDYKTIITLAYADQELALCLYDKIKLSAVTLMSGKTVTAEYVLAKGQCGVMDEHTFGILIPEEPNRGAKLTYSIPADVIFDIYGNSNEALTLKPILYSYGYTLDAIIGDYTVAASPLTNGSHSSFGFKVAASAKEGYDVAITFIDGVTAQVPIQGTFNTDTGVAFFKADQIFAAGASYLYGLRKYTEDDEENADLYFQVPMAGMITLSDWLVFGAYDKSTGEYLGYFDVWANFVATRNEPSGDEGTTALSTKDGKLYQTKSLK